MTDHFTVDAPLEKTWAIFSAAENLPRITPPALGFDIKTPMPVEMRNDLLLDYTIRWMGLPVRWRTRIIDWSPPHQFIDLQLRGPYTLWHHQHRFFAAGAGSEIDTEGARSGGTECSDRVIYKLPGGPIGSITHALVVRRQLMEIFQYRLAAIGRLLGKVQVHEEVQVRRLG